MAVEQR